MRWLRPRSACRAGTGTQARNLPRRSPGLAFRTLACRTCRTQTASAPGTAVASRGTRWRRIFEASSLTCRETLCSQSPGIAAACNRPLCTCRNQQSTRLGSTATRRWTVAESANRCTQTLTAPESRARWGLSAAVGLSSACRTQQRVGRMSACPHVRMLIPKKPAPSRRCIGGRVATGFSTYT